MIQLKDDFSFCQMNFKSYNVRRENPVVPDETVVFEPWYFTTLSWRKIVGYLSR